MKMTANRLKVLAVLIKHQGHDVEYWDLVDWAKLTRPRDTWQTVGALVEMGLVAHSSQSKAAFDGHKLEHYTEHRFTLIDTETDKAELMDRYGIEPEPLPKPAPPPQRPLSEVEQLRLDNAWLFSPYQCRSSYGCKRKAERAIRKAERERKKRAKANHSAFKELIKAGAQL